LPISSLINFCHLKHITLDDHQMKKTLIVAAALSAIAGTAAAQSSVTLFGVVDVNAQYIKNTSPNATKAQAKNIGSGGLDGGRLGFRGVEDLGSGLKANFWLEMGVGADTGASAGAGGLNNDSGRIFGRRSTLGLEGSFGEVRVGRDFTPTYKAISKFDAFGDNGIASYSKLISLTGTGVQAGATGNPVTIAGGTVNTIKRSDNQVSYLLPKDIGGIYGQFSLAPSEGGGGNRHIGFNFGYSNFGLDAAVSFGTTKVLLDANAPNGRDLKTGSIGASYDMKVVKLMGAFSQYKFQNQKESIFMLGVTAPVSTFGVARFSVARADVSGGSTSTSIANKNNDAFQVSAGYVHNLSKRTALYSTVSYIKNKSADAVTGANASPAGQGTFKVGPTNPDIKPGGKSAGAEVGVRHMF
jgi:predicted porin